MKIVASTDRTFLQGVTKNRDPLACLKAQASKRPSRDSARRWNEAGIMRSCVIRNSSIGCP